MLNNKSVINNTSADDLNIEVVNKNYRLRNN